MGGNRMKRRFQVPSLIFYGIAALMIVIGIVSFVKAVSWVNRPFPGFLLYKEAFVGSFKSRDWPGIKAGLKFVERIVEVDGEAVLEGQDVLDKVGEKEPGTPVRYLVESKGETREVVVPVAVFTAKDFLMLFVVVFLGGLIIYAFGIIVYFLKPNMRVSWVFLLSSLSLGTYMVSGFEIMTSYFFARFHYFCLCLIPTALFHLFLIFPTRRRVLERWPALEYLIYAPGIALAIGYQIYFSFFREAWRSDSLSWLPTYTELGSMVRAFMAFSTSGIITFILLSLYRAASTQARQRARMILFGFTIAFAPPMIIMGLSFLIKFNFPWNFFPFFIIFFPAAIAYSIVRHNLFDADTIIRRTVGYAIVTAVVVGAYALVSVSFNVLLGQYQLAQSRAFPILFTLGVILVFNPLRDRIQALVDRVFFRKEYDYGAIIDKIGGAITSLIDLGQILKRLTQTFIEDMFINTTSVMLLSADGSAYQVYLADGENNQDLEKISINRDEPIVGIIEKEKKELTKNDILEDPKYKSFSKTCVKKFEDLNASLMVPMIFQDKVIGFLTLGEKKSGKYYNREDIDLLHTVSNQGAVAIENARLFQENLEKQRMEEELNIARDLQTSMLPATCPAIKGFQIAASSTPAREVGGDFFDFIEIGENSVGLVVGDVTGKSVSGALVMSASRSVFRMLSEDELTVGESMTRANRRLKKDIKSGMFVALLYVVLDGQEKSLNLCSAGQTQPVHLSVQTGEASLVQTEGDTFPLGILDEADYKETKLQLEAGDKVVFYTDGIVEAMNQKEEMFGFERLMEVTKESRSMSADAILKEIINSVNEFAGGAAQHDDLTVIVVSVEK